LNIDGSRIGRADGDNSSAGNRTATFGTQDTQSGGDGSGGWEQNTGGRWPANIILDEYTAGLLDEQSGFSKSTGVINRWTEGAQPFGGGAGKPYESVQGIADSGGASRFFYVSKTNKKDRNEGLENLPDYEWRNEGAAIPERENRPFLPSKNHHPTVKPTALMEYLVKLVTPPNGTVLDPFTGSGSTGKAALLNGFKFIGIELTEEYLPIIEGRLRFAAEQFANKKEEEKETLF
jgi:site-specific DNA-methyltransferase (adenine-specific)